MNFVGTVSQNSTPFECISDHFYKTDSCEVLGGEGNDHIRYGSLQQLLALLWENKYPHALDVIEIIYFLSQVKLPVFISYCC